MARAHTHTHTHPLRNHEFVPWIFPAPGNRPWRFQNLSDWFSADPRHHDKEPKNFPGHDVVLPHRDGHYLGGTLAEQIGGWMWRHTDLCSLDSKVKQILSHFGKIPLTTFQGQGGTEGWVRGFSLWHSSCNLKEATMHAFFLGFDAGHTASILSQDIPIVSQTQRKPSGLW